MALPLFGRRQVYGRFRRRGGGRLRARRGHVAHRQLLAGAGRSSFKRGVPLNQAAAAKPNPQNHRRPRHDPRSADGRGQKNQQGQDRKGGGLAIRYSHWLSTR